ncbi:MAG: hypothetical protein GY832_47725 [Chloroflexi bacterium]|nr:hypothetical protein [Chloroflexota bacterium]
MQHNNTPSTLSLLSICSETSDSTSTFVATRTNVPFGQHNQAVTILDADQMLALIEAIRPQAPHLADTLAQWVRNFGYEKLIALVTPEAASDATHQA